MSNRTAIIASAVAVGLVSLFSILSAPAIAAPAEEPAAENDCLAAPKATTPAGAHWYYRVEKGTKRKCWYLSDAGGKVNKPAAAATTTSSPVAEQDAAPPSKPMRKSVANARAELTAGSPDEDQSLAESTWPPLTPSDQAAVREENQTAAIQPASEPANTQGNVQGWNIASRWPEPKTVASAEDQPQANAPEPAQPAPALTPDRLAAAAATPTPAATQVTAAQPESIARPVDASSDDAPLSIRVLLSVLVCALALAAIIGPMIFRYIRPRRKDDRTDGQRRAIWDMDISSETVRQDNPRMASTAPYIDALPEPRVLDEAVDELENLLARASRRSAA
jgi:hypothetical protein